MLASPLLCQLLSNQSQWLFLLHWSQVNHFSVCLQGMFVFCGYIFCLLIIIQSVSMFLCCDIVTTSIVPSVHPSQSHHPTHSLRINISHFKISILYRFIVEPVDMSQCHNSWPRQTCQTDCNVVTPVMCDAGVTAWQSLSHPRLPRKYLISR